MVQLLPFRASERDSGENGKASVWEKKTTKCEWRRVKRQNVEHTWIYYTSWLNSVSNKLVRYISEKSIYISGDKFVN